MSIKSKIAGGIATGAILAGIVLPSGVFASTVTVHGNGQGSNNAVNLVNVSSSSVKQVNKTAVVNLTAVVQNTGGNKANSNTKGPVSVTSGNAKSDVTNTTTSGVNVNTSSCGCLTPSDDTLKISGNGDKSSNTINVTNVSSSSTTQVNKTLVVNGTFVLQNTGGNSANGNTGGDVTVSSGNANSTVTNDTTVGGNVL